MCANLIEITENMDQVQPTKRGLPACDNPLRIEHKKSKITRVEPVGSKTAAQCETLLPQFSISVDTMVCNLCRPVLLNRVKKGKSHEF